MLNFSTYLLFLLGILTTTNWSVAQTDSSAIDFVKIYGTGSKNSVNIKWEVSTESGGDHFILEKHIGEDSWQRKAAEDSKKNHIFYQTYEKSITNYAQRDVELFRIVRVDANGERTILDTTKIYHPVLSNIKFEQVHDKLNQEIWLIYKSLKEMEVNVTIINLEGKVFFEKKYPASIGDNNILLKIKKLKPGNYQVTVRDPIDNKLTKLLVVH